MAMRQTNNRNNRGGGRTTTTRAKRGDEGKMSVADAGRKGGLATSREHGPKFYHTIGSMGGKKVAEYIAAGKKALGINKTSRKKSSSRDMEE